MDREKSLEKIAAEIAGCRLCKKGGTGKVVPGEGNPDARIVFVGEAPGREEAGCGRPFVGRSGKFLRQMMRDIGLEDDDVFITSPGHYMPLRGTPSKETIIHGREHLQKQIELIDPEIIVLLGSTACFAILDRKADLSTDHGKTVQTGGRTCLITFHPAYAMRFPEGRRKFIEDFRKLRELMARGGARY
jgi:DNA polymerase